MCSVRHRPMPSPPKLRAVDASSGVSALARTFSVRISSTQPISLPKSPVSSGWIFGTSPCSTSTARAVDGDRVAFLQHRVAGGERLRRVVDAQLAGAGDARRAHAAGDHRRVAGHAAAGGENALARRACRRCPRARSRCGSGSPSCRPWPTLSASSAEKTICPDAAPGDAGRPLPSTSFLRLRVDHRVQQLVELRRLDAADRFLLVDQTLLAHLDGDAQRGRRPCACRCGSAASRAYPSGW